jgi:DNA-binding beta-propeller fold protein YncE
VAIGGQGADIALDEPRGVLYIADFTANRIDVMTLADQTIHKSFNVNPQPGSLSLSPDGQFLVVVHFGNFAAPAASNNALTVIHLADGTRQTFGLAYPPLGVAFGNDGLALIVTTTDFELFEPITGSLVEIATIGALVAKTLPQPLGSFPPNIVAASLNVNANSSLIIGLTDTIQFSYNTSNHQISIIGYTASPPLGPRVVSVSGDGSYYISGWALYLCGGGGPLTGCTTTGPLAASFDNPSGILNVGSHAIDSNSNTVYAQIPGSAADKPTLLIADADNLNVRDKLQLPENLAGKSVLNAAATVMYSISASGVMVLPVGTGSRRLKRTSSFATVSATWVKSPSLLRSWTWEGAIFPLVFRRRPRECISPRHPA